MTIPETRVVRGCLFRDTPANRDMLTGLIPELAEQLMTPYRGSTKGECQHCWSPIWIGPAQSEFPDGLTLCLVCFAIWAQENDAVNSVTVLTNKRPGQ